MSLEIVVLRTLLRLSRRRHAPSLEQIQSRSGGELTDVQRALGSLSRAGLVSRAATAPRLTLAGLAIAAAISAPPRAARAPRAYAALPIASTRGATAPNRRAA